MGAWHLIEASAIGLCAGLILVGLVRLPRSPVTAPLLGVAVCTVLWGIGELLTNTARELIQEEVGIALSYTGSIFLPPLWWALALRWAEDRGSPLPLDSVRWTRIPLAWAVGMWAVMITNPWHELLLTPVIGDWNVLHPLWWVLVTVNYALVLSVIAVELWVVHRVREPDASRQAAIMIGASLVVLLPHVGFLIGLAPSGYNPTVIVLACSAALLFAGMRYELGRLRMEDWLTRQVAKRTRELDLANASLHSVNERLRELQSELVRAERLDVTESLAGSVAHAINNPLTALRGTVEMALETSERSATLERILHLVGRIDKVVQGTLALVRHGELQLRPVAPRMMLEELREELAPRAAARHVEIQVKVAADVPDLVLDHALMGAALVSIAENSLEKMGDGGHLWLEAEVVFGVDVVAFRIADTGPGVPADLRERIFQPFFSTRGGGTGLGLAIAQGIVQGHGGRICIADRPGGGALFTIELPLRAPGDGDADGAHPGRVEP